jgi:hypothetical protein
MELELTYISIIILIILGLALAFLGKRILETFAFLIGAIAGAALALMIAPYVYDYVSDSISENVCILIAVIVGALIGGFLGRALMYGLISFLVASIVSYIVFSLTGNPVLTLISFFITLIIMWFMVEKFLAVVTALLGGCMVGVGVMFVAQGALGPLSLIVFIIIAGALTFFGARYQLEND